MKQELSSVNDIPKFSIIIPAHNEEDYIIKTVLSTLGQDRNDFETIIVVNACEDNTEQKVNSFIEETPFQHIVKKVNCEHANVGKARNVGAKYSKGKILIFLDADTLLEEKSLNKIESQFTKLHSVASCKVKPDINKIKFNFLMNLKNFNHTNNIYHGSSGIIVCRKNDFELIGGFNEKLTVRENKELIQKLKQKGRYICIDSYVTTSMRRFDQWGIVKAAYFWTKQHFLTITGKLEKTDYEKIR
ncbi:glycosyltransferase [archaeon]|jgi:glycosyltransferase involved in cell wall biosynthesis|nr:glycosyltransferase [archaeon]MBT3451544.1 glycosyltransferase [archaeon]MBT6869403.1 glycosyltransferase [archaeon]MBT7192566.1 glycosyltransferase [archaeon]MBT7380642.1 glycosyltransferase [archaeon]